MTDETPKKKPASATPENRVRLYMTPEYQEKAKQLALQLQKQGVSDMTHRGGEPNFSALFRHLIDKTLKSGGD